MSQTEKNVSQVTLEPEIGAGDVPKHVDLKIAIVKTGLTQKEFAAKVGIAESHLSMIVNGKRPKSLDQAMRIAREVGMTVEELWPLPPKEGSK